MFKSIHLVIIYHWIKYKIVMTVMGGQMSIQLEVVQVVGNSIFKKMPKLDRWPPYPYTNTY